MITLNNADAALKDYYLDAVSALLNGSISPFFNAIEKTTENVFGKDVKMSIVKGGMGNVIAGDEDGDLPSPYSNRYYGVTMPLKNIYGTIEISDKALRASREDSGAFVNLLNAEMEGLVGSAKANFARMLYGDGNGLLCNVITQASQTNIVVDSARQYFIGLKVDLVSSDGTVVLEGCTITDVSTSSNTVCVDAEITTARLTAGDKIYVSGVYGKEICGLAGIFDGSTLYGYTKSVDLYFSPYRKSIAGATLTEEHIIDMLDTLEVNHDSKVNMILCSHASRKQIANLLSDNRRIVNTQDLTGGFAGVYVNDVPVYADKYCPDNRIYFLNTDDFILNQLCDWEWMEDESGKVLKQVPGKAAYSATLVKYAELICKKPCGQGLLTLA